MESLDSLVLAARRGDESAFTEIVRRLSRRAVGTAHLITGDLQHGEEAAQDAFVAAWKAIGDLKDPVAFRGWFGVILARTAARRRRSALRPLPPDLAAPVSAAEETLPEPALGLKRKYREVLALRYVNDLSYVEIAAALGITVARVKSRLFDARRILRTRYEKQNGGRG